MSDLMSVRWFPVVDDCIGGWAVATADLPVSEHGAGNDAVCVGDFLSEEIARHVAGLHNATLEGPKP